jgi:hypothetical protein
MKDSFASFFHVDWKNLQLVTTVALWLARLESARMGV